MNPMPAHGDRDLPEIPVVDLGAGYALALLEAERRRAEALLAQATDCDPENLLSTTFLTADVGKLYLILSRSLGRTQ